MNGPKHSVRLGLGHALITVYFMTWIYLVAIHIGDLSLTQLTEVFMNALIIALFVGLGLNIYAFEIHARSGNYRSLKGRILYVRDHRGKVLAFYAIPFCVSSASSLVAATDEANLVRALFGTGSYALIILVGFTAFILLPALYILYRHGWNSPSGPARGN